LRNPKKSKFIFEVFVLLYQIASHGYLIRLCFS